jgi:hypothetical protein
MTTYWVGRRTKGRHLSDIGEEESMHDESSKHVTITEEPTLHVPTSDEQHEDNMEEGSA